MKSRFFLASKRLKKQLAKQNRALWIGSSVICFSMVPSVVEADTPGVENPPGTQTFTTDQSDGVNVVSSTIFTVNVRDIVGSINPASGTSGIHFRSNNAGDLTLNAGLVGTVVSIAASNATGVSVISVGAPPAPQPDTFLGIPIPTSQKVQGGVVNVNSAASITTTGTGSNGIRAQSSTTGYPGEVANQLNNFVATNKAAGFVFKLKDVFNVGGSDSAVGSAVTASRTNAAGEATGVVAGSFVFDVNGGYVLTPGTAFNDLTEGQTRVVRVEVVVTGKNPQNVSKDDTGFILIEVKKTGATFTTTTVGSGYAEFGASNTAFPDLNRYVTNVLTSGSGGAGNSVNVHNTGTIQTNGVEAHGVVATSQGGYGGDGRDASVTDSSTQGGDGSKGGQVTVTADGSITTTQNQSAGVLAWSTGGNGGTGGDSGYTRNSKAGGSGAVGGDVLVNGSGTIHTSGLQSSGILAVSQGGSGGSGGDGSTFNSADAGGGGGEGGNVEVNGNWNITTTGDQSHAIWAKSTGGVAGGGGDGGWTGTSAGPGGNATNGGDVLVYSGNTLITQGDDSYGIYAESIGGFGGGGGSGTSIFYAAGGSGASAGSGGDVGVTQEATGQITTGGARSHGIFAQSVGGGGGSGGGAGALVGLGGGGESGGNGGTVSVNNAGRITTTGENARGIYAQSVGGGGGDGGNAGGLVAVGGNGSTTSDAGNVNVGNTGTIASAATAIFAQSIGGGGGSGGSSTGWFSFGGSAGSGGNAGDVRVGSKGNLTTTEANASAIFAQSVGGGGGNGGNSTAVGTIVTLAIGGGGGKAGDGGSVNVGVNPDTGAIDPVTGIIRTSGDYSRGIQAQSVGGGGGNGGFAASLSVNPSGGSVAIGLGGSGAGGGNAGAVGVYAGDANTQITTDGKDAHGIFAQSVGGGGGSGGFSIAAGAGVGFSAAVSVGGKGGGGGDGGTVDVGNLAHQILGTITTNNSHSYGIFAQSVGGGGGDGGYSIAASATVGGAGGALSFGGKAGAGGIGKDVNLYSGAVVTTKLEDSHAIFAQSVGGGGGSGGFSVAGSLATAAVNIGFGGEGATGGAAGNVLLSSTGSQITTGGTHSYGIVAQSIGGGGGDGGFSVTGGISAAPSLGFSMGGSGAAGNKGGNVTLTSSSNVTTTGKDSHAIFAQSVGGGGGSGGFSVAASISVDPTGTGAGAAINASIGGKAGGGGDAGDVTVTSTGTTIKTSLEHSYGILAQSIGGGGGDGGFSVAGSISTGPAVSFSMGGSGGAGGVAGKVAVNSSSNIATKGANSHAIFAQSVGGGGGSGGFSVGAGISTGSAGVSASVGGKGATGGNGNEVHVGKTSAITGTITTGGENSYGVLAQSIGGGGGDGGFSVAGGISSSAAINFSMGGDGGKAGAGLGVTLDSAAKVGTTGLNSHGLFAQSVGGGGGSGGFSVTGGASAANGALGVSLGGSGAGGGNGGIVKLYSTGESITTGGNHSYAILAQSIGGGGGDGGFSIAGGASSKAAINFSLGGSGGPASKGSAVTVENSSNLGTTGNDSHGLFAQSVGGGGGSGGFSITGGASSQGAAIGASIGGAAGAGGNAGSVTVTSTGDLIITTGDHSDGIHAQSIGGGGGDGGFSIAGGISKTTAANFSLGGSGGVAGAGDEVEVTNSSYIETSGQLSTGLFAQSVGGGGGSGGFSLAGSVSAESNGVSFSMGGKGGAGGAGGYVHVNNSGSIWTGGEFNQLLQKGLGSGSTGVLAQSIGGGGGNGGFSGSFTATLGTTAGNGLSVSVGGNGGGGGIGGLVELFNSGDILTMADDSIGLQAQSIGGGGGNGGFSLSSTLSAGQEKAALSVSIGGKGLGGGNGGVVVLNNSNTVTTVGSHSQGIFAQSLGGGGGSGGFSATWSLQGGDQAKSLGVSIGGSGGIGGDGGEVTVTNTGAVRTFGDDSAAVQAQSIGGGGGNGGFSVTGSMAGTQGKSLAVSVGGFGGAGGKGGTVNVLGGGGENDLQTSGDRSAGVLAQSIGGGGGNGGFSAAVALGIGGNEPGLSSTSVGVSVGGFGGIGNIGGTVNVGTLANRLTGDVVTQGLDSAGIFAQSVGGGGGTGGFSLTGSVNLNAGQQGPNNNLAISVGGFGGVGNNGGAVNVYQTGSVHTVGDGSYGIQAQSIGGGGGDGGSSRAFTLQLGTSPNPTGPGGKPTKEEKEAGTRNKALALAVGGSGAGGGDGGKVTVDHIGDVTTEGGDAHGIFAQSIGGGGGNGGDAHQGFDGSGLLKKFDKSQFKKNVKIVVGGSGGASGNGDVVEVTNTGKITTYGPGAHGVFAQSIGGGGGTGGAGVQGATGTIGIGGGTNSSGSGGAVNVTINGSVDTYRDGSNGIFAQSIGGGGGTAGDVDRGLASEANVGFGFAFGQGGGNAGDGGAVTIKSTADITTRGHGSSGIFAQSVGGGGGVVGSLGNDIDQIPLLDLTNFAGSVGGAGSGGVVDITQKGTIKTIGDASHGIFAQSTGGLDKGEAVNVKVTGDILTAGHESNAIFAQSLGTAGNGDIKVEIVSGTIQGGLDGGAAVKIIDGKTNTLLNGGTIQSAGGIAGTSIFGGAGAEKITNTGTVKGSVRLGAGANSFTHQTGALLESGAVVDLGAGNLFLNSGTISAGGIGVMQTTELTGDFTQSGDAIWIFDLKSDFTSDLFAISGTANLGSHVNKVNLNALNMASSEGTYTLVTANSGLTGNFQFGSFTGGTLPVGFTYSLLNSDTQQQLQLAESSGPFYWRGGASNAWNGAFIDGVSNWTSDGAGNEFIFGTPGVNCDVFFSSTNVATMNRTTTLGADFAVNSITITDALPVTIGGDFTLTLAAAGGAGINVQNGAATATISADIALGASQAWTNNSANPLLVTGDFIKGNGQNLTITGSGNTGIGAAIQTNSGSLTKSGSGTLALYQTSSYSGGTTLSDGFLQVAKSKALGTGNVNLTGGTLITLNDPSTTANSPLALRVGGNYTQAAPAVLELRIIGPSGVNDQLLVAGEAFLGGTLRPDYSALGYNPIPPAGDYTDVFNLVHSNVGITGQFNAFVDVHYNADNLLRWEPVYTAQDVFLEWNQHPFTELMGLTRNQTSTAEVLNKAVGLTVPAMPTPYNDSTGPALLANPGLRPAINYLNTRPLAELPRDYDLIAPEELTAIYDSGRAFTQVETANIENRLREIRSGAGSGFSDRGFTVQKKQMSLNPMPTTPAKGNGGKEADIFTPGPDNRWGVFISGAAQSLDVGNDGNSAGFDLDTNGVTIGADYRVNDHFALGVFHQYTNSAADLVNNGSLKSEGSKAGIYATVHDNGYYLNGLVAAGASSYSSHRLGLNGFASGDTGGWDLDAMISGGYNTRVGALTFGPLASLVYTRQQINNFTETGSMLPLYYDNQEESSLASRLGFEASYDYKIGGVTLVPQISLAWQHEFLRGAYDVTSSFAQGPGQSFTVAGPSAGRDSLDLRAGVDVLWTQDFGTYVSYQTEIGRTNYQINSGTVGFHWKF